MSRRTMRFDLRLAPIELQMLRELARDDERTAADTLRRLVRRAHEQRVRCAVEAAHAGP